MLDRCLFGQFFGQYFLQLFVCLCDFFVFDWGFGNRLDVSWSLLLGFIQFTAFFRGGVALLIDFVLGACHLASLLVLVVVPVFFQVFNLFPHDPKLLSEQLLVVRLSLSEVLRRLVDLFKLLNNSLSHLRLNQLAGK